MSLARATTLFPLWAVLAAILGWLLPEAFSPLQPAIVPGLGVVMLGMGLTLTLDDFRAVLRRPGSLGLGTLLQIVVMPAAGWLAAVVCGLDPVMVTGMVLVGAAPVGTAASVVTYLARGNVALAVSLTVISTVLAIVLMPAMTGLFAGEAIAVATGDMLIDVLQIVLLPVAAGTAINTLWGAPVAAAKPFFPLLSVAVISLLIAIIVALSVETFAALTVGVVAAVVLHNAAGLALGYAVPALLGMDERTRRTLAIVVGMQNSGLAVALAAKYLGAGAVLPGALFSVWHNITGSLLAGLWSRRTGMQAGPESAPGPGA